MLDNCVQCFRSGTAICPHSAANFARALSSSAMQLSRLALVPSEAARQLEPTSSFGRSPGTACGAAAGAGAAKCGQRRALGTDRDEGAAGRFVPVAGRGPVGRENRRRSPGAARRHQHRLIPAARDDALRGIAVRTHDANGRRRSGRAGRPLRPLRSLRALRAGRPGRAGRTGGTGGAGIALRARGTGGTRIALRSRAALAASRDAGRQCDCSHHRCDAHDCPHREQNHTWAADTADRGRPAS